MAVLSSTWDYYERQDEFRRWLRTRRPSPADQPADIVEWNLDKRYLIELEAAGCRRSRPSGSSPAARTRPRGRSPTRMGDVVIKPVIDLGGDPCGSGPDGRRHASTSRRWRSHTCHRSPPQGELSLVYVDGDLTHSLRKVPARGDFRVQPQYGGTHE